MNKKTQQFIDTVWSYYHAHGRQHLPWRQTHDPYCVLVSELMLQQTQVERVMPKYVAFIERWPTTTALAGASLGDVLRMWQGLGYNRRAKFLLQAVQAVEDQHGGIFPLTYTELLTLPGVGPYTAGAICAFAYNYPVTLIETNVRRVYIHHFFQGKTAVTDAEILPLVTRTVPADNPREWYAALMDYGTYIKKAYGNMNVRSKHYTKQSAFTGSDREIRGAIIRYVTESTASSTAIELVSVLSTFEKMRVQAQLQALVAEGLVVKRAGKYRLP